MNMIRQSLSSCDYLSYLLRARSSLYFLVTNYKKKNVWKKKKIRFKKFLSNAGHGIFSNYLQFCSFERVYNLVWYKITQYFAWPLTVYSSALTSFTRFCSSFCVSAQQIFWPFSSVVTVNSTKFHMSSSLWTERSLQGRHMFSGCGTSCFSFLSFCHTITTVNTIINNKTFRIIITTARFLHLILFCAGVSSLFDPSVFSVLLRSRNLELSLLESILDHGGPECKHRLGSYLVRSEN